MIYIIDANNLAGEMGLLGRENFDQQLTYLIKRHMVNKKIKTFLVFDGFDFMGDKITDEFFTVIYTPKDGFYESADDKIIELAMDLKMRSKDEIAIITDDKGLIDAVRIKAGDDNKIKFIKAVDFTSRLKRKFIMDGSLGPPNENETDKNDKNIGEENVFKINDELLKIWKNKKTD